ncbi:MAG: MerR family transcriptional regulator [Bacteroidales bacterium]|nr:MerR family transcriptional regulator [Bacteroidales bacterium]
MKTTKRFYTVSQASELLSVPASTLRWWEEVFPMFNPNRLPSGRRRFTEADVKMAEKIKELLHVKGMKTENAVILMNKTYRKYAPRRLRKCATPGDAIALLDEVKSITEDIHALAKIETVEKWIKELDKPVEHKNIRGKEYYAKTIEESKHGRKE